DRDYTDGEDDEDYAYDEVEDEEDDRYVGHASGLHSDLGDQRGGDEHTYEDADRQGLSLSVTSADMINALIETSRARPSSHRLPIAQLVDDDVDRVYSSQPYHSHHHHRRRRSGPVFTASHTLGAADPYAFAYPIPEYQCAPLLNPRRRRPRQYDLAPLVTPPAREAESKSTQAPLKRRGAASTRRRRVERAASPDRSRAYHRLVRIFALNGRRSLRAARNAATALQRVTQFRQCARFSPRRRRRPDPIDLLPQPLPPGVEHPHRVDREPPSGSCIVCQEGLDTSGVYGMVALLQRSKHLRKLPLGNRRHILDLLRSPESLDVDVPRPEALRVRGVETSFHSAPQNPPGFAIRGFPASHVVPGMVVSSCGHLMHLRCFDSFYATIEARRGSMPTRNHPENVVRREFMCPFCKALGNALVPALPFVPSLGALLPLRFSPARPSAVWPRPQTAVDDSDTPCHDEDDEEDPYPHHFAPSHSRDPALASRLRSRHADAQFKASTDAAFGPLLGALADLRVSLSSLRPPAALDKRTRAEPHKIDPRPATRPGVASYSRPTPLSVRPGPDRPPALDVLTNLTAWRDVSATSGPGLRDALTHLIYNLGPAFNSTQLLTWDHVLNAVDFGPHTPPLEDLRVVPPLQPPLPLSPALLGLTGAQDPGSVEHAKVVFSAYQAARRAHEARRRMQLRLEAIAPHVAYTDDVKVVYYRLADVLRLHFHSQGATMTGQYFDRLLTDIFYYTVSVTEATLRGTRACQRTGTVLDSVSETTTALLHLLSQLILHLHNLTRTSAPRQPWLKRPARQRAALWLTKLLQPYLLYDAAALRSAPEAEAGSGPNTRSQPTYRPHDDGFRPPDPNMYTYLGLGYQAMDGAFREPDPNDDGAVVAIPEGLLSATATATAHALETSPQVYAQPLLLEDPFQALVEFSAFAVPEYGLNVLPYLLLFYAAEVTRAVLGLVEAAIRPDKPAWVTWAGAAALSGDATVEHIQAAYRTFDVFRPDLPPNLRHPPESRSAESSVGLGRDSAQGSDAGDPETKATAADEDGTPLSDFAAWLMRKMACPTEAIAAFREQVPEAMLAKLVRSLTLPFLRKTVILLHTHFGMAFTDDYPHFVSPTTDEDHDVTPSTSADELWGQYAEFDRLVYLLNLPPLVELARLPSDGSPGVTSPRQHIYSFIADWCQHLRATVPLVNDQLEEFALDEVAGAGPRATVRYTGPAAKRSSEPLPRSGPPLRVHIPPIPLISPAIMELTTLPTCFDYLFNGSNHVVCPRCEQVPTDPALCMFCGEFVCAQTACCEEDFYGECNLHMMACHGPIGIFLLVKNNAALLLSNDNGTFIVTPYRDYHGEMDLGLKRGRPLFLDQKRFDELRRLWLTQQVPNAVARSLENAFDT
ncbi:E3 ubiquitin-protein ligase ubr1, partial [Tieghemiomyces parasiticus]